MSSGIRWDILANIGKTFTDAYDGAQKRGKEQDLKTRLAGIAAQHPDGAIPVNAIARGYLEAGDSQGALAAVQLAQAAEDRRLTRDLAADDRNWRRSVDARDHAANRRDRDFDERKARAGLTLHEMQLRAKAAPPLQE